MNDTRELLALTAEIASDFLESLDERGVFPPASVEELRERLGGSLPEGPTEPRKVIADLAADANGGIVAIPGGRYFGFVIGGAVPAALAADWLTSAWDQNAGLYVGGPAASVVEEVANEWLAELLGLPADVSVGYVTGCQMAHVTALAAARYEVLHRAGWDVNRDGLFGAPPIRVVVGAKRHVTVDRALRLLGIGTSSLVVVPADDQGRIDVEAVERALAAGDGPAIVCGQAGEVNTGAFDDLDALADVSASAGAWLHIDGAFGLWAAASPELRHLTTGAERADSWATDCHKWLNVPYDSGLAITRHPEAHRAAMSITADYLIQDPDAARDQVDWTPEFSRRARGFAVYAAIRQLGCTGIADIVDRTCSHARRIGEELARMDGVEVLNEIVLNQVLFRFDSDERTAAALAAVQESGEAWLSGTAWDGRKAIRVSVSNWQTTEDDVARLLGAFQAATVPA